MYWCTKRKININQIVTAAFLAAVTTITSCSSSSTQQENNIRQEFDIPSFFKKETNLLNSAKPTVRKTVEKDAAAETKDMVISDWDRELASFLSIDLNKSAYQGLIQKDSSDYKVKYTFKDTTLDLNYVEITYRANQPLIITIERSTSNLLYDTNEILQYIKGQSYRIDKKQKVRGFNQQHYIISGKIEMVP